jgi:hypothetical protein
VTKNGRRSGRRRPFSLSADRGHHRLTFAMIGVNSIDAVTGHENVPIFLLELIEINRN